jgi:hypothetical protein
MALRHEVRILERQLHGRVRYRPVAASRDPAGVLLVTSETLLRSARAARAKVATPTRSRPSVMSTAAEGVFVMFVARAPAVCQAAP